jgi:predicted aconitase with swiveling domain
MPRGRGSRTVGTVVSLYQAQRSSKPPKAIFAGRQTIDSLR